jgi:hypothetical protein
MHARAVSTRSVIDGGFASPALQSGDRFLITKDLVQHLKVTADVIHLNRVDTSIAVLMLRQQLADYAAALEDCKICRRDILMSKELDKLMIDAKGVRQTYFVNRWKGFKMFLRFEKNVLRAACKWVLHL